MSRRHTVAQIDAVLAHPGNGPMAAADVGVGLAVVSGWRSGRLPAFYRVAKGLPAAPAVPSTRRASPVAAGPKGATRYTVAQIDRALACDSNRAAAASLQIPEHRVAAWRAGDLPSYYHESKRARTGRTAVARDASRFLRPQDARAGR